MSIGAINNVASVQAANTASKVTEKNVEKNEKDNTVSKSDVNSSGVIYEKSSSTENTDYVKKNAALIKQLKEDADARVSQLRGIVEKMMQQQGVAIGKADDMWKFLAEGDFTVSAEVKAQAEKDIAEDGYWGVEQTSDRILDFAKALSGGDPDKAEEMLEAFKKGFEEATSTWGKELPEISQKTYDAVLEKFDAWKNGTEDTTDAAASTPTE